MIIVQIAGRLGKDPEVRFTPSGQKVTKLVVATNVYKNGKEETVWWNVSLWGTRFDKLVSFLKKGSAIIVVGEMSKPEIYTDKEGRPQVSMDMNADIVKFMPSSGGDPSKQDPANAQAGHSSFQQNANPPHAGANAKDSHDEPAGFSNRPASNYGQANTYGNEYQDEQLPF